MAGGVSRARAVDFQRSPESRLAACFIGIALRQRYEDRPEGADGSSVANACSCWVRVGSWSDEGSHRDGARSGPAGRSSDALLPRVRQLCASEPTIQAVLGGLERIAGRS